MSRSEPGDDRRGWKFGRTRSDSLRWLRTAGSDSIRGVVVTVSGCTCLFCGDADP